MCILFDILPAVSSRKVGIFFCLEDVTLFKSRKINNNYSLNLFLVLDLLRFIEKVQQNYFLWLSFFSVFPAVGCVVCTVLLPICQHSAVKFLFVISPALPVTIAGEFADNQTQRHSGCGLVNSRTGRFVD